MASVIVRKQTNGTEAERLLNELEAAMDMRAWPIEVGRRFDIDTVDHNEGMEQLESALNGLSDTWPIHLRLEADPLFPDP